MDRLVSIIIYTFALIEYLAIIGKILQAFTKTKENNECSKLSKNI
ncbi:hypothetical protein [Helicobacter rodentium]|nr:hypothetical protein [Helicobacter rodentium]